MDDTSATSTPVREVRRSSRLSSSRSSNASDKLSSPDLSSPSVPLSSPNPLETRHISPLPSLRNRSSPKQNRACASPLTSMQSRPSPFRNSPFPARFREPPIPALTRMSNHDKSSPTGIGVMNQSPVPFHPLEPTGSPTIPEGHCGTEQLRRFLPAKPTSSPPLSVPIASKKNDFTSPNTTASSRASAETAYRSPISLDDEKRSNRHAEILSGYTNWLPPIAETVSQDHSALNKGEIQTDNHENFNNVNNGGKYTNDLVNRFDHPNLTKNYSGAQCDSGIARRHRNKSRGRDNGDKNGIQVDARQRERSISVKRGRKHGDNFNKLLSMHKVHTNIDGSNNVRTRITPRLQKILNTPIEEPVQSSNVFKTIAALVLLVILFAIFVVPDSQPIQNTEEMEEIQANQTDGVAIQDYEEAYGNEDRNDTVCNAPVNQKDAFNEDVFAMNDTLLETEVPKDTADMEITKVSAIAEEPAESATVVEDTTPPSVISDGNSAHEAIVIEYNDICFPDNHAELIIEPGVPMYLDSLHFEYPSIPLLSNPRTLDLLISETSPANSYSPLVHWKTSFADGVYPVCGRETGAADYHDAYRIFAEPVEAWIDAVMNTVSWLSQQLLVDSVLSLPFMWPLLKRPTANNRRLYHSHLRFGDVCPDRGLQCYHVARLMLEHPGYSERTPKSSSIGESSLSNSLNQVSDFISGKTQKDKYHGHLIQSFDVAGLFPKPSIQRTNPNRFGSEYIPKTTQEILISRIGFVITSNYGASNTCIHKLKAVGRKP